MSNCNCEKKSRSMQRDALRRALLLERMAETGEPISALAARLPRFYRKLGKIAYRAGAWIHVCASNTEPLLRLAAEARSEAEAEELYGGSSTAHLRNTGCIRGFRVIVYGHSEDASYDSQPIAGRHSSVFRFIAVRQ